MPMTPSPMSLLRALRRAAALALVVGSTATALAGGGTVAGGKEACFESWWREALAGLERRVDEPSALATLRLVDPLVSTAADPREVIEALDALRGARRIDPLVADEIDAMLVRRDRALGRDASARARLERLGTVLRYAISGPFDSADEARRHIEQRLPGERTADADPMGILQLGSLLFPPEDRYAVASVDLVVTGTREIAVRYGADDRAELWVDGVSVHAPEGRHSLAFDQHAAGMALPEGRHRLAWLVEQDDVSWQLSARFTKPDGDPLDLGAGLTVSAGGSEPAKQAQPAREIEVRTLTGELERLAVRGALERSHVALDLAMRQLPDRAHSRAISLARDALDDEPDSAEIAWILARVETDPARARDALERTVRSGSHGAAARRELAHYYLRHDQSTASLEWVRRGLSACSERDPYLEAWEAIVQDGAGFTMGAVARLEQLAKEFPHQPLVLERLAALAQRSGFIRSAREALEALSAIDRLDTSTRRMLIDVLADAGESQRVISLMEEGIAVQPMDPAWHIRLARLHLLEGRLTDSQRVISACRALMPDNPAVSRLEGEIALAAGDEEGAARAWQRALDMGGQGYADLRARLATLTGGENSFGESWALPLTEARQRFEEAEADLEGDPPFVSIHGVEAIRLEPDGRSVHFRQILLGVRHAEKSDPARGYSITYSPTLQRAHVLDARLVRADGSVMIASRNERPLLPDPEIRMWYDTRVIQIGFPRLEDGDVLEIRYRLEDRGATNALGAPYFGRLLGLGRAVPTLGGQIVLDAPDALPVRHRLVNLPAEAPVSTTPDPATGRTLTRIGVPPLPAYADAPAAPPAIERIPYVVLGSTGSWEELGSIYADLLREQLDPPPELEQIVARLTAGLDSRREVVDRLYRWVLENTRYVALEFGIHAIKPYPVDLVLRRRHGDCKDKAGLLVSMLDLAGVKAHVALLRSRMQGEVDTEIPVFEVFDHAIVYVPGEDLWLDGTVLHFAPGELPLPDRQTLALVVESGNAKGGGRGRLVTTPAATAATSRMERQETIRLERSGAARIETEIAASGDAAARERSIMRLADNRDNALRGYLSRVLPELTVEDTDIEAVDLDDPVVRYRYAGRLLRFAQRSGDSLSFRLAVGVPGLPLGIPAAEREIGVWLPEPITWTQRTVFRLPPGARILELPADSDIRSPWGRISTRVRKRADSLTAEIDVVFEGGRVAVEQLAEYSAFARDTEQALNQRILLEWP